MGLLESAIAQPRMTFGGEDLYPSLLNKAAALGFSIIMNHPFVDGNQQHTEPTNKLNTADSESNW